MSIFLWRMYSLTEMPVSCLKMRDRWAGEMEMAEAIDYIYVHIMDRITIQELASATCLEEAMRFFRFRMRQT